MKVEGSTFLVTGGSSGLGLAASEELFMRGANIVIADLLHAELAHFQGKSHHTNNRIVYSKTSVTEPESIQDTVGLAFREFGVLHGVINCAGIGAIVKTVAKKKFGALENARRVIEINLLGTYNVVSIAASAMSAQAANADGERGVFINTASVA
ncbi:MAG TPA: SDR family NAD(P)-dependent oxidoreductase, partial [Turneriella sp.]|nr:SDR family NAD(P)-dependent oxidoreductase [Turneriella sp.]